MTTDHTRLFQTCVSVLDAVDQAEFVAAYFDTTVDHATWLIQRFIKSQSTGVCTEFEVFSSSTDQ